MMFGSMRAWRGRSRGFAPTFLLVVGIAGCVRLGFDPPSGGGSDSAVIGPDGSVTNPDSAIVGPDGSVIKPDGPVTKSDGPVTKSDGPVTNPDTGVPPPPTCGLYVNDTATSDDAYTSAPGSDTNPGTAKAPLATLAKAIQQASSGSTICVDTGTYAGDVCVIKSVTIVGVRQGVAACGRTGAESVIRGELTVTSAASDVTLDGLRLERRTYAGGWNGVNLLAQTTTFRLLNSKVVPFAAAGGYSYSGYVGVKPGAAPMSSLEIRSNEFGTLVNTSGCAALFVGGVTVSGTANISSNCFKDCGGGATVIVFGGFNVLKLDANVVINSATGGAGGIGVGSGAIKTLLVTNNRILNSPIDGLFLGASAVNAGSVTGNVIQGSGTSTAKNANLNVDKSTALAAGFAVKNNDLSSPAGTNPALSNAATAKLDASCNWYGTSSSAGVTALVTGNVGFLPFLTSGTDTAPGTPGFQPASGTCTGL